MNLGQYTFQVGVLVHSKLPDTDVRVEENVVRITSHKGSPASFSTDLLYVSRSVEQAASDIHRAFLTGNTVASEPSRA